MYRRMTTLLSPLLLATLALPAFVAPQALAVPPQATRHHYLPALPADPTG
jgi:hypothetical protein